MSNAIEQDLRDMARERGLNDLHAYLRENNWQMPPEGSEVSAPLSGEWADTFSYHDLRKFCENAGVEDDDSIDHYADAYEDEYYSAYMYGSE